MTPADKKLVYVLNYVSSDDTQHFVHVLGLLTKLQEHGWSVVVVSEKGGEGVQRVLGHDVHYMSKTGSWTRGLKLASTLIRLRSRGYRLVFVRISRPAALISAAIGKLTGSKTLFWLSGTNQDLDQAQPPLRRFAYNAGINTLIALIDHFVTGPELMAKYFKTLLRVPDKKMLILYNDVELARFKPNRASDQTTAPLRVLFVHSLSPNKEASRYFPSIVRALTAISKKAGPIKLIVVGKGPERAALEAFATQGGEGLEVEFLGGVPNIEIMKHYDAADVFIMPSYREGFPRVVIEAMAMGLPIVSTDAGGTRDLFGEKQQAFVVPRDDAEAFAARLADLMLDSAKRQELSVENLDRVQRFSTDAVARMYDSKLSAVLAGETVS
jgi:glycosyltransferase involved in cell wall biosynthesis